MRQFPTPVDMTARVFLASRKLQHRCLIHAEAKVQGSVSAVDQQHWSLANLSEVILPVEASSDSNEAKTRG